MSGADANRDRLLQAAGEEFAERGFAEATVRSILKRAGMSNIAAVNYYFGDKETLYEQAVKEAHHCGVSWEDEVLPEEPAEQLRLFIRHFLTRVLAIGAESDWRRRLMLREMMAPSGASDALVRDAIRPQFERLQGVLRRLVPGLREPRLTALAFTVIGQCLFYKVGRPVAERLIGEERFAALDLDFLTDHITTVALAAVRGQTEPDAGGGTSCTGSP